MGNVMEALRTYAWVAVQTSRPAQLLLIVGVYLLGATIAVANGASPAPRPLLLGGLPLVVLAASVHYANEYADYETDARTERTAVEDVVVTKHLDHETLSSPVLVYEIESVRDDPATVRITEPILGPADEDSRPMGDSWRVDGETLVYESVVAPGETATTLVGRPDCPTEDADRLLETPDVTVE